MYTLFIFICNSRYYSFILHSIYISKSFTRSRLAMSYVYHALYWDHSFSCLLSVILRGSEIARTICLFVRSHHLVSTCWCICLRVSSPVCLPARLLACSFIQLCSYIYLFCWLCLFDCLFVRLRIRLFICLLVLFYFVKYL